MSIQRIICLYSQSRKTMKPVCPKTTIEMLKDALWLYESETDKARFRHIEFYK